MLSFNFFIFYFIYLFFLIFIFFSQQKEADFVERITKYRLPTAALSDDYYGDKVKTLTDYKNWLRQQKKKVVSNANDAKKDPFQDFGKKKDGFMSL